MRQAALAAKAGHDSTADVLTRNLRDGADVNARKRDARPAEDLAPAMAEPDLVVWCAPLDTTVVLNGTTEIRGSLGEISATHVLRATAIWLHTMETLTAGDTVGLQGYFRFADGYFAADQTSFWGAKTG